MLTRRNFYVTLRLRTWSQTKFFARLLDQREGAWLQ